MSSNKRKIEAQNDTPSKRKVNWLSLSEKLEVIKRSDEGATCSKIAKDKNVPDSTVRRILKNKVEIKKQAQNCTDHSSKVITKVRFSI